jgi:hypothetical protein
MKLDRPGGIARSTHERESATRLPMARERKSLSRPPLAPFMGMRVWKPAVPAVAIARAVMFNDMPFVPAPYCDFKYATSWSICSGLRWAKGGIAAA